MSNSQPDTESDDGERLKNQSQYAMYLPEELETELNEFYEKYNANRVLNDKDEVEKNRHFNVALVKCALDNDLSTYIDLEYDFE